VKSLTLGYKALTQIGFATRNSLAHHGLASEARSTVGAGPNQESAQSV
jgi:hypothetical protein